MIEAFITTAITDSTGTQGFMSCVFLFVFSVNIKLSYCFIKEFKMKHQFSRNELAYGQEGLDLLKEKQLQFLG